MKAVNTIVLAFLLAGAHGVSYAQEELAPTEKKQRTLVTEPITVYKGFFRTYFSTYYSVLDKSFVDHKKKSIDGNGWGSYLANSLFLQYGITDRLMVEATLNYINDRIYQSFTYEVPIDPDQIYIYPRQWVTKASGVGDTDLSIDYQILKETQTRPAIALFTTVTLPTGTKDFTDDNDGNPLSFKRPTGQGEIAVNLNLRLRKVTFPFAYGGYLSYKIRNEVSKVKTVGTSPVYYKNGNLGNAGGFFHLSLNDWISLRNFADAYYAGKDKIDGVETGGNPVSFQYTGGFSFQLKRLRLDQFVIVPFAGNNSGADPSYSLIVSYVF